MERIPCFTVSAKSDDTPFTWCHKHEHILPRVAFKDLYLLSIPATRVRSERIFSKEGRIITKSRAQLTGAHVEKYIVLNEKTLSARRKI